MHATVDFNRAFCQAVSRQAPLPLYSMVGVGSAVFLRFVLARLDIHQRGLVLPTWGSKLEHLPRFQGSLELSTIVESATGTTLLGGKPVPILCSTRQGKLVFTSGWYDIVQRAGLKGGDIVSFYKEDNEGAEYKMKVRIVG